MSSYGMSRRAEVCKINLSPRVRVSEVAKKLIQLSCENLEVPPFSGTDSIAFTFRKRLNFQWKFSTVDIFQTEFSLKNV